MEKNSIIYSSLRSLLSGFFLLIGISIGSVFLIFFVAAAITSTSTSTTLEKENEVTILPDASGVRTSSSTLPVLLKISIDGTIGTENLVMEKVRSQLQESQEDNLKGRVKGIFLYINSPGGTVTDSDGIYWALKDYKEKYKVPVIAFTEGLCASGGYYIACSADKIYSTDTTMIGSVGVIFSSFLNLTKLLEKVGVDSLTISAGKGKDDLNPLRTWKPDEAVPYKELCDFYYNYFVSIVTANRPGLSAEKLKADLGARVFAGPDALKYGYIDQTGVFYNEALTLLVKEAGLENETYQVIELTPKLDWSTLFKGSSFLTGSMKHEVKGFDPTLSGKFLYLYSQP